MLGNFKKENAITLVALVITVIILLILAGITIAQLSNNGLFGKVEIAKWEYENAQEDEEKKLEKFDEEIDYYVRAGGLTEQEINEKIFGKELWINSNPTAEFAAQTVNINDIMSYKKIEIIYKTYCTAISYESEIVNIIAVNQSGECFHSWQDSSSTSIWTTQRHYTILDTGIKFEVGRTNMSSSNDNGRCVPYKILGYK